MCPHCGAQLPRVVDAFCPECRGALDELPEVAGGPTVPPETLSHSDGCLPVAARHTRLFVLAFYALAVVWGVRNIWFWKTFALDRMLSVGFAICLGWWAVADANWRRHPIPILSRPWFFLLAGLLVPGYVIWSRRWRGVGWLLLHAALWCGVALAVMHIGGFIVYGHEWLRVFGA